MLPRWHCGCNTVHTDIQLEFSQNFHLIFSTEKFSQKELSSYLSKSWILDLDYSLFLSFCSWNLYVQAASISKICNEYKIKLWPKKIRIFVCLPYHPPLQWTEYLKALSVKFLLLTMHQQQHIKQKKTLSNLRSFCPEYSSFLLSFTKQNELW